jgi:hypothetical protein
MPSPVAELLAAFDAACGRIGVRWYLFGAQAALIHGAARLTGDVDVTVELGTFSATTFVSVLAQDGFMLRVAKPDEFVEQTRVIPVLDTRSGIPVDVVLAGPGIEELFLERATRYEIEEGVSVPVACPEDLIVMKILAMRPKDLQDVAAILAAQGERLDEKLIRSTLALLEQALGQSDLVPELERLLARAGSGRG